MREMVRIGCGAGFWGDTPEGPAQLVRSGRIDYLVLDYLAEITMSILARMKAKRPDLGYATDFATMVMKPLAREIGERNIRVVTNAGGVNPEACRDTLRAIFAEQGLDLKIALVRGDDISTSVERCRAEGVTEMFSGRAMPEKLSSVNAYLGAFPIAAALDAGADIVLTGRCVDSAMALGPLIHEFGWSATDHDLLSTGSLAGHILECGAQATGGIFTDWQEVEGWDRMGFPIAECRRDGTFEVTKPDGTGGMVTTRTIAEQVVYEVGDPATYVLPDVTCDWSAVRLAQAGKDRVRVSGARGRGATPHYKVSATYADGYRSSISMMIAGRDAVAKAQRVGKAILDRSMRLMSEAGFPGFSETSVEVIGGESSYGEASRAKAAREVILKIGVRHASKEALEIFAREIYPAATAMAQGITGFAGGRPAPQPVIRLFSFLTEKSGVPIEVDLDGRVVPVPIDLPNDGSGNARARGGFGQCGSHRRHPVCPVDRAGACAQRRQGRFRQHRRARPQAGVPAGPPCRRDREGRRGLHEPFRRRQGRAVRVAGARRFQLPATRGARRRRHRIAAARSARKGLRPDTARHARCRSRRLAGAGRPTGGVARRGDGRDGCGMRQEARARR